MKCELCKKTFSSTSSLNKHKRNSHGIKSHQCSLCCKNFTCASSLARHKKIHDRASLDKPVKNERNFKCSKCDSIFKDRASLYEHQNLFHHVQKGGAERLQAVPLNEIGEPPWNRDEELENFYRSKASFILEEKEFRIINQCYYNCPLPKDFTMVDIMKFFLYIYEKEPRGFKLNFSFNYILRNTEDGTFRLFKAYKQRSYLARPITVVRKSDLAKVEKALGSTEELFDYLMTQRPNTKHRPELICGIRAYTTLLNFTIGSGMKLPDYITSKRSIIAMTKSRKNHHTYKDKLCFYRCMQYNRNPLSYNNHRLFEKCVKALAARGPEQVTLDHIPELENTFKTNIEVYSIQPDDTLVSIYRSPKRYKSRLQLNLFGQGANGHFSVIKKFEGLAKRFQCFVCEKLFSSLQAYRRHSTNCRKYTSVVFPQKFYQPQTDIFSRLEETAIVVPQELRTCKYFAVFDIECALHKKNQSPSANLTWLNEHKCISISMASSLPGFRDSYTVVGRHQTELVDKMFAYLELVRNKMIHLNKDMFAKYLDALQAQIDSVAEAHSNCKKCMCQTILSRLRKLMTSFTDYVECLPVLGFNASKYDLVVLKHDLIKKMLSDRLSVIKKNNNYLCIRNEKYSFLDMINFCPLSYDAFLKAFSDEQISNKLHFPFEYVDSFDKLQLTSLPAYEAFESRLAGGNLLEVKHKRWLQNGRKGKEPKTGREIYSDLKELWAANNCGNLKDFLILYNSADTVYAIKPIENYLSYYASMGMDPFKTAISLSGLARKLLMRNAERKGATFALVDKKNKELYYELVRSLSGGYSAIHVRRLKSGTTPLRKHGKLCRQILGYDAVGLYTSTYYNAFPVGPFIRRRREDGFKAHPNIDSWHSFIWLDFCAMEQNVNIRHRLNYGKEVYVHHYPVDGYCPQTGRVYQYNGCFYHGHRCRLTRHASEKWMKSRLDLERKRADFFKKNNVSVCEIFECQFLEKMQKCPELQAFVDAKLPEYYRKNKSTLTQQELIDAVKSGELFGLVQVDIEVKQNYREYYNDYPPLFFRHEVKFDDLGEIMQKHIRDFGLSQRNRTLLISSMRAERVFVATPLLKFYLENGLVVKHVYQSVEFNRMICFDAFAKECTDLRRKADRDPSRSALALLGKMCANTSYGSLLLSRFNHTDVLYVTSPRKASAKANDPRFLDMSVLGSDLFELRMGKKTTKVDLSIFIPFFILSYAKLRMLEFYVFLKKSMNDEDWTVASTDTDSLYLAISGVSLEETFNDYGRKQYHHQLYDLCGQELDSYHERFFPRACCAVCSAYDRRTPGLFVPEYKGTELIGLSAKTYCCTDLKGNTKLGTKGINKERIENSTQKFESVLDTQHPVTSVNVGFRENDGKMHTYEMSKKALSFEYWKRIVDEFGYTRPLDVVLRPPEKYEHFQEC